MHDIEFELPPSSPVVSVREDTRLSGPVAWCLIALLDSTNDARNPAPGSFPLTNIRCRVVIVHGVTGDLLQEVFGTLSGENRSGTVQRLEQFSQLFCGRWPTACSGCKPAGHFASDCRIRLYGLADDPQAGTGLRLT